MNAEKQQETPEQFIERLDRDYPNNQLIAVFRNKFRLEQMTRQEFTLEDSHSRIGS